MDIKTQGWINGFIGVAMFAGSLPATRVAVADFSPLFLTSARAVIAALLGAALLVLLRQRAPRGMQWLSLAVVAVGVVIGFPLFTALALQYTTSAHTIVFVGLLPLCTALFSLLRGGSKPRLGFWLFALAGALCVSGYAAFNSDGAPWFSDAMMVIAIVLCALGYAEGAALTRLLGGWQVISWALVLALPLMAVLMFTTVPSSFAEVSAAAWWGLAYVSLFSMLLGFVFWYRGLMQGGVAAVGQLQLLQPFMSFVLAAWILGESVHGGMWLTTALALLCVAGAKKYAA